MTREEFIGIAADAILRDQGLDPKDCPMVRTLAAVAHATAALEAVGAWDLLEELRNIAGANPSTWEPEVRDQFQPWAQSRARSAIAKAEGR